MSKSPSIILESLVAVFFVITIVYAVVLTRRLNARRRDEETDTKPERLA